MSALSGPHAASGPPGATAAAVAAAQLSFSPSAEGRPRLFSSSSSDDGRLPHVGDFVSAPHHRQSLIGEPVAAIVDRMLVASAAASDSAAASSAVARSEFCIAWPPTFPVGGPAEIVELRAALSLDAAEASCEDDSGGAGAGAAALSGAGVGAGRDAAFAAAAAGCCSRLLAVREDLVVGDERVKVSSGGEASARLRLHSDHPGVTTCILTGEAGVPTLESFGYAAPLMGLPQAARDEAHRLLWRMMHEALPPNHSVLPYDPDAFRSPIDRMAPRLQAALSWAWSHHFRAFAQDFCYLLDCPPPGAAAAVAAAAAGCTPRVTNADDIDGAAAAAATAAAAEESAHYQSVLAQMVVFLRDNDMFACLATLLQTAVARGLADGACAAVAPPPPLPAPPASPSVASEASYEPLAAVEMVSSAAAAAAAPPPHDSPSSTAQDFLEDLEDADAAAEGAADDGAESAAAAAATTAGPEPEAVPVAVETPRREPQQVLQQPQQRQQQQMLQRFIALLVGLCWAALAAQLSCWGPAAGTGALLVACLQLVAHTSLAAAVALLRRAATAAAAVRPRVGAAAAAASSVVQGNGGGTRLLRMGSCLTGAAHVAAATWYGADAAAAAAAAPAEARSMATAATMLVLMAPVALGFMSSYF
ncbi:hypothetical protein PLESTB_001155500 [Pleodorina starrii]|uniref:Uncharacterized protein n=1 Tax=Pleodorina starrii TaxID=330485 RepID=A0A9W6BRY3_9CHLO|nr:hypothetical protein PLESTM_001780400 [Pleodorina starrii]GLC56845.1 hypothetical protein PLESTB_001155500 [Pleodorina starrii]GLC68179.1 hypothetical protein PLESTF_000657200 [Pleodorina starrii]